MKSITINGTFILRHDLQTKWEHSTRILARGELGVSYDADDNLVDIRIGTGAATWNNAPSLLATLKVQEGHGPPPNDIPAALGQTYMDVDASPPRKYTCLGGNPPVWAQIAYIDDPPAAHASSHGTDGTDPITPTDIGAAAKEHEHVVSDISDFSELSNNEIQEIVDTVTPSTN